MTKEQLWQGVLGELELNLSKANFTTWFKNTFIFSWDETKGEIVIAVPNAFTQAWLEKKYHKDIKKGLINVSNQDIKNVIYKIENIRHYKEMKELEGQKIAEPTLIEDSASKTRLNAYGLNPYYTFDNFVVGKNNELAYAACKAVAEKSGEKYNPLFIYSGVGLGKTHLLQAIGHAILEKNPKAKVLYVSCEKFTNDYIRAIHDKTIDSFKKYYRTVDLLLVDDVQFMAGKEGTQEEFFHTFNELHQKNRQIVITSDRLPKTIPALEERLISRFEWGLITDISKPDLETRLAILNSKCEEKKYKLSDDILKFLASTIQTNVRELEGALNKVIAYHNLYNLEPTLDSTKNILSSLKAKPQRGALTPRQVIKTVSDFYEIKPNDLCSKTRKKEVAMPRQIAMYLLREEVGTSYPSIGQELGGRDHTTAIHAYNKIKEAVEEDGRVKDDIEMIKQRLYNT
jgi:chromosomal replication initiator protein